MAEDKKKYPRLMVVNEPYGRRSSRALSCEIGHEHAEILLQMEYLISISTTPMHDDRLWTKQSIANLWMEHFPYWGETFIRKVLNELCDGYTHKRYEFTGSGRSLKRSVKVIQVPPLLDRGWFNNWAGDTTTWYALNHDGINTLSSVHIDDTALATVRAKREPGTRQTRTGSRDTTDGDAQNANALPAESEPVHASERTFHTQTPTETPTEGGALADADDLPPAPPNFPDYIPSKTEARSGSNPHNIVTTRNDNIKLMEGLFNGNK